MNDVFAYYYNLCDQRRQVAKQFSCNSTRHAKDRQARVRCWRDCPPTGWWHNGCVCSFVPLTVHWTCWVFWIYLHGACVLSSACIVLFVSPQHAGLILSSNVQSTVGGIACTVVGYPFDTFKVRMQMGSSFTELLSTMRFQTLFAGIASPIFGAMPCWAAGYMGYNLGKEVQATLFPAPTANASKSDGYRVTTAELLLGGFTSGFLTSLIRCPTDVVKVNCQNTGSLAAS